MKPSAPIMRLILAGGLALSLTLPPVAIAETAPPEKAAKTAQSSQRAQTGSPRAQDKTAEKRKEIVSEAIAALRETENALKALDENKAKEALSALERATGKLEIVLARDPALKLAPVGVGAVTYDILGDVKAVRKLTEKAKEALDDGRVQKARHLIRNLASETVIRVSNLPLGTYPGAIKLAAHLLDKGKIKEAKTVLQSALNSLVITETIIPLPVVAAETILADAEKLAEKKGRSEEENKKLKTLIQAAKNEIEFAEALGYGTKEDFKNLYEQIEEIGEKTRDGKFGTGFFDKIKAFLKDATKSSQNRKE